MKKGNKALVLDTGAFLSGYILYTDNMVYTVPEVIQEIKDSESRKKLEMASSVNRVIVIEPAEKNITEAIGKKLMRKLSDTDKKLLYLLIELKDKGITPILVTDDYSLQEACVKLGFQYLPIRYLGIDKQKKLVGKNK